MAKSPVIPEREHEKYVTSYKIFGVSRFGLELFALVLLSCMLYLTIQADNNPRCNTAFGGCRSFFAFYDEEKIQHCASKYGSDSLPFVTHNSFANHEPRINYTIQHLVYKFQKEEDAIAFHNRQRYMHDNGWNPLFFEVAFDNFLSFFGSYFHFPHPVDPPVAIKSRFYNFSNTSQYVDTFLGCTLQGNQVHEFVCQSGHYLEDL